MDGCMDGWLENINVKCYVQTKQIKCHGNQPNQIDQSPVTTSNIYQVIPKHPIKNNTPKTPIPKSKFYHSSSQQPTT